MFTALNFVNFFQFTPTHNVQVYDMKGAWTKNNRTVVVKLYDSYMAAKSLKANLSSAALKGFKRDKTHSLGVSF